MSSSEVSDIVFDIETTGLKSTEHRITCIGIKTKDKEIILLDQSEKKVLEMFWTFVRQTSCVRLVGFNSKSFDVPFLVARSALHKVSVVDIRWCHIDLRKELTGSPFEKGKLDDFAALVGMNKLLDGNGQKVDGKEAIVYWETHQYEKLKKYLLEDIRITWALLERLKHIGWITNNRRY